MPYYTDANGKPVATMGWVVAPFSGSWWKRFISTDIIAAVEDVIIPDFGLFGGPGYCGDHLFDSSNQCIDGSGTKIGDALAVDAAYNPSGVTSKSDEAFKIHDQAYYDAWKANQDDSTINKSWRELQADAALLQSLYNVFTDSNYKMDKQEIAYDLLAAKAFAAKILAFDLAATGVEGFTDTAVQALKNTTKSLFGSITTSSEAYTVGHLTLPANFSTSNPITGDLAPIDFEPYTEGIQTQTDEWGNIKTEPSQPSPGRADTLYDTSGNDSITGGGGDDNIYTVHGGSDRIQGGAGNDNITQYSGAVGTRQTLYNTIIEGGPGSDIILGHYTVSNQLFGDTYGDMATLIAAGKEAPNTEGRGDFISDYYLPEYGQTSSVGYLYGSNSRDILINNTGMGVIVGGGGDDLIYGDFTGTISANNNNNWGYTVETTTGEDGDESYTTQITGISITDNTAVGAGQDDVIYAGTGNDFVYGGGGDDEVYGGAGNDSIFGEAGSDFIEGGDGNDILTGDNGDALPASLCGADYIDGGAGNDEIEGNAGNDELFGGADNDTIYGGDGDDYLDGMAGQDSLYGGEGADVMFGGDDNDYLDGYVGDDYLDGEAGDDTLIGAAGADLIFGGDGNDTLIGDASNVAPADQGDDYIDGEGGNNLIAGYGGNDTLYGGSGNDTIYGGAGDDYIDAGDGINEIYDDEGNNEFYTGAGDDTIQGGSGNDYINAGEGDNWLSGGNGNNTIFALIGNDHIQVGVDFDPDGASINYVDAGDGDNIIYTVFGSLSNEIYTGAGNDTISGLGSDEYINAGDGDNVISGGTGSSEIYTGTGDDTITGGTGYNYISAGDGNNIIYGGSGSLGNEIYAGAGNDQILGDAGNDGIRAGGGNDTIYGATGHDWIQGGAGNDTIGGDSGNDYLEGGTGSDSSIFDSGDGADTIASYADDYATATDIVQFGAGITIENLVFTKEANNLMITIAGTSDSIVVQDWFSGDAYKTDQFIFSDTTVLTAAQIDALGLSNDTAPTGGYGNDTLAGTDTEDILYGYDGNDILNGYEGDDIIDGGSGNDTIHGGAGNDTLNGGYGSNLMDGGAGDDYLDGREGANQYIINRGSGFDTIDVSSYGAYDGSSTVVFGEGITPDDISVQMHEGIPGGSGDSRSSLLAIGIGNNEGLLLRALGGTGECGDYSIALADLDVRSFVFANGQTLTLDEIIARASEGNVGEQWGTSGDDSLIGSMANDIIYGDAGNDIILGGAGNDTLDGGVGSDTMTGGTGNDYLSAEDGHDQLEGGEGNDTLIGGTGNDTYVFNSDDGVDTIDDIATPAEGNKIVFGAGIAEDDLVFLQEGSTLTISIGNNGDAINLLNFDQDEEDGSLVVSTLQFADGSQMNLADAIILVNIIGTEEDDFLAGTDQNDFIQGLGGNDYMAGSQGNDIYVFGVGYGQDVIDDWDDTPENLDTILLKSDISPDNVKIASNWFGDLILSVNSTTDTLKVQNFFYDSAYQIEQIQFADGTVWDINEIYRRQRIPTEDGDLIWGTCHDDYIQGFGGDDCIGGNEGNDTLDGGTGYDCLWGDDGNDVLFGGEGDDYLQGDIGMGGNDILYGEAGDDELEGLRGNDTMIGGSGNDWYWFELHDGVDTIEDFSTIPEGNTIAFYEMSPNDLTFTIQDNTLTIYYGNYDDAINLVNFDQEEINGSLVVRTLQFLHWNEESEEMSISEMDLADFLNQSQNHAPIVANPIANQTIKEDEAFNFTVPSDTFNDSDIVDALTYTATLADGVTALPDWLYFDANTQTFNGTPTNSNVGTLSIKVTATDTAGQSVSDEFNITVNNTNDVPVVANPIASQTATQGVAFTFTVPANTFSDPDVEDTLIYNATNLPPWLSFNPTTMIFSGTPVGVGSVSVTVLATDNFNASVSNTFNINVQTNVINGTANADNLIGTSYNNIIYGLGGNDTLSGEGGNDYVNAGEGNDQLQGGDGNDTLIGGVGSDTMTGGTGNDSYYVDNLGDVVNENAGEGTDAISSSVTYVLGDNIENMTLTGTEAINGTGNSQANQLYGNASANTLSGEGGNDYVNAGEGNDQLQGGDGNDTLIGGVGSDTYLFGDTQGKDTITETAGVSGDIDTLKLTEASTDNPVIVKNGNDLYVFTDANDYVKITGEFQATNYGIERLEVSDGHYITRNDIQTIVDTMSAINNNSGMDIIQKYNAMMNSEDYQNILAQSWQG